MMGPLSSPSVVGNALPCRCRAGLELLLSFGGPVQLGAALQGHASSHFLRASGGISPATSFHPCWLKSARHHMLRSRKGDSGSLGERPHLIIGPSSETRFHQRAAQTSQAKEGDALVRSLRRLASSAPQHCPFRDDACLRVAPQVDQ